MTITALDGTILEVGKEYKVRGGATFTLTGCTGPRYGVYNITWNTGFSTITHAYGESGNSFNDITYDILAPIAEKVNDISSALRYFDKYKVVA